MNIIVIGAGQIGTPLIEMATQEGNEVTVIEYHEERAKRATSTYDCLVINDDATVKDTLSDAGAENADVIISTTDQDTTNIMVALLAKELGVPEIVSVVHNPDHMNIFHRIGVHVMGTPQRLIAKHLYQAVSRRQLTDFMQLSGSAEIFDIAVAEGSVITGKTLKEAAGEGLLAENVLIVAIDPPGDEPPIIPKGGTQIEAGDILTVYSGSGAKSGVTDVFS